MIISFTSSIPTAEQAAQIESFLAEFLPRMREIDGVEGIFHYAAADSGEHTTVVLWRDDAARHAYMAGDLVKEAIAFEQVTGNEASRRGFPVTIALP